MSAAPSVMPVNCPSSTAVRGFFPSRAGLSRSLLSLLPLSSLPSRRPVVAIQASVIDCFGKVMGFNVCTGVEIGNGA